MKKESESYAENPNLIRKEIIQKRNLLSEVDRAEKSLVIAGKLLEQKEIIEAVTIFIYINFRSEVQTRIIIDRLLEMGKQVSVPLTRVREKKLEIVRITDPDKELVPGYCDIPEPREELVRTQSIPAEDLDVIILPGSVFDLRCGRFGYGGGFYDRLLASIPTAARIALAFDVQMVEQLPLQDHDELLDAVITETQLVKCSSR